MKTDKLLEKAIKTGSLTRFERSDIEEGDFDGYVIAMSDDLFLFAVLDDLIVMNGFSVLNIGDVTSIEVPASNHRFKEAALRIREDSVGQIPQIDLSSFRSVIETASQTFPLVSIFIEDGEPGVCYIGRVVSVNDEVLSLHEITPNAEWDPEPTLHDIADITRVDFGGRYEDALYQVGGEPPRKAARRRLKSVPKKPN